MPAPASRIPVEAIREAARLAVEATSLRSVARAVRLSPTGLKNFLNGREPYSATRRKLNAWFVQHAEQRPEYAEPAARASLAVLTEGIPAPGRGAVAARILEVVREGHERSGTSPPAWLETLGTSDDDGAS